MRTCCPLRVLFWFSAANTGTGMSARRLRRPPPPPNTISRKGLWVMVTAERGADCKRMYDKLHKHRPRQRLRPAAIHTHQSSQMPTPNTLGVAPADLDKGTNTRPPTMR